MSDLNNAPGYRELLLGCGYRRDKMLNPYRYIEGITDAEMEAGKNWRGLVTLDLNASCEPDILCDLVPARWRVVGARRNPSDVIDERGELQENCFHEVHAYEVLEHLGHQGDYLAFFAHFSEIYRILKPGGFLCATVPSRFSPWLWGDPGHCRAILPESLVFLDQEHYAQAVGKGPSSDYRSCYVGDFRRVYLSDSRDTGTFAFVLQAIKPSRLLQVGTIQ